MAIKTGTQIKLQECSLAIQHECIVGQGMLGHLPADTAPTYDTVRQVVRFANAGDDVSGLFDPTPYVNSGIHPFLVGVQITQDAGLAWAVHLTSGDPTLGSPLAVEVHDPMWDIVLADSSGLGTGSKYVQLNRELLPGQRVRVVLPAASTFTSRVLVMFANTVGAGGRLLG